MEKKYNNVKGILTGERLGPVHSLLSQLISEVKHLEDTEISSRSLELHQLLENRYLELLTGGSCLHGADQGPQCKHCKGVPAGPFLQCPPGFDVAEVRFRLIANKLDVKRKTSLELHLTRVEQSLKDVHALLRLFQQRIVQFEKLEKIKRAKIETSVANEVESLNTLKIKAGLKHLVVDPLLDANSSRRRILVQEHVSSSSFIDIDVDLSAKDDLFLTVMEEITHKFLVHYGRRFEGKCFLHSPLDTMVRNEAELEQCLQDMEADQELRFILHFEFASHESFSTCYGKCATVLILTPNESLLAALSFQSNSPVLQLVQKQYALDNALFESLKFRHTLRELNLAGTQFDLSLVVSQSIASLSGLEVLRISRDGYTEMKYSLCQLSQALQIWTKHLSRLQVLDISNWNFVDFSHMEELGKSLVAFVDKRKGGLQELILSHCLHLPFPSFLNDDEEDLCTWLVEECLGFVLSRVSRRVEFDFNCFFPNTPQFMHTLFSVPSSVSLFHCRTYHSEEHEDDFQEVEEGDFCSLRTRGVQSCTSLLELNLEHVRNLGDQGMLVLCQIAFPVLQLLNVGHVGMGTVGMTALLKHLSQNFPQLKWINLSDNASSCFQHNKAEMFQALNLVEEVHLQGFPDLITSDFTSHLHSVRRLSLSEVVTPQGEILCDGHEVFLRLPHLQDLVSNSPSGRAIPTAGGNFTQQLLYPNGYRLTR